MIHYYVTDRTTHTTRICRRSASHDPQFVLQTSKGDYFSQVPINTLQTLLLFFDVLTLVQFGLS